MNDAQLHNPDVLSCLANLSNDEVFTPPQIANAMLDLLPQELFSDPNTTFLDPCCKSGVFLREIAKRLNEGLASLIPNQEERIAHIFTKQLFGIAITELTSLLSRRGVYCSKYPNSPYSVVKFDDAQGNIRFKHIPHTWSNGRCVFCGASQDAYGEKKRDASMESHAYEFIHITNPEQLFHMNFDVIIGNPPYQLSDGGGMGTSAIPLYNSFIEQAKKLNPRYLSMIIPARWYSGGKGLDDFRTRMLNDRHISHLVDFFNSTDCFPGVDLSGGVCYFLWDNTWYGDCNVRTLRNSKESTLIRPLLERDNDTFVRFNEAITIIRKTQKDFKSFGQIVSARRPFGDIKTIRTEQKNKDVYVFAYPNNGFVDIASIEQGKEYINKFKVFISKAYGERGEFPYLVLGKPFVGFPNSCCSETYLIIDPTDKPEYAENIISYMKTKFFRFLVLLKKNTQNAPRSVYSFVPLQDFSKPWTDEELYAKYGLTEEEIAFIDSMIRPME